MTCFGLYLQEAEKFKITIFILFLPSIDGPFLRVGIFTVHLCRCNLQNNISFGTIFLISFKFINYKLIETLMYNIPKFINSKVGRFAYQIKALNNAKTYCIKNICSNCCFETTAEIVFLTIVSIYKS